MYLCGNVCLSTGLCVNACMCTHKCLHATIKALVSGKQMKLKEDVKLMAKVNNKCKLTHYENNPTGHH